MSKASIVCLAALQQSHLTCIGQHWMFRNNRLFSMATVNKLIALGLAVREGNIVRAANA